MRQGGQRRQQHTEKRKQDSVTSVPHNFTASSLGPWMTGILIIWCNPVKKNRSRMARPDEWTTNQYAEGVAWHLMELRREKFPFRYDRIPVSMPHLVGWPGRWFGAVRSVQ